jgi:CYTH domain-containing protein
MQEIERRFLVKGSPPIEGTGIYMLQGYIHPKKPQVRIRITSTECTLTIKYKTETIGIRDEYEQIIGFEMANELYKKCEYKLQKWRYKIPIMGTLLKWEIDVYPEIHNNLIIAEIELPDIDYDLGELPSWIGKEITGENRYSNISIAGYRK